MRYLILLLLAGCGGSSSQTLDGTWLESTVNSFGQMCGVQHYDCQSLLVISGTTGTYRFHIPGCTTGGDGFYNITLSAGTPGPLTVTTDTSSYSAVGCGFSGQPMGIDMSGTAAISGTTLTLTTTSGGTYVFTKQ